MLLQLLRFMKPRNFDVECSCARFPALMGSLMPKAHEYCTVICDFSNDLRCTLLFDCISVFLLDTLYYCISLRFYPKS